MKRNFQHPLLRPKVCGTLLSRYLPHIPKDNFDSNKPIKMMYNIFGLDYPKEHTPLVIMHDLFGSRQSWRKASCKLADKLENRIYTVDARNHGDSPHTKEHSIDATANDVEKFVHSKNLKKINVLGHNMGGSTMIHFALKYPQLIERGIIVDIPPLLLPRGYLQLEQIFKALNNVLVPKNLSLMDGRIEAEQQLKNSVPEEETLSFLLQNLRKLPSGEFYWAPNIDCLQQNLCSYSHCLKDAEKYKPHSGPMMFICGKESNFVNKNWPTLQTIFPNSEIHWFEETNLINYENHSYFNALVTDFLRYRDLGGFTSF